MGALEETADDINKNHRNSEYLGDEVELSETLRATTDFTEAANCADVIVMGVPSHGFRGVLDRARAELRPWVPVVSLVKGLEQGTNMRMSQIVDEVLPGHPAGILAGPEHRPRGRRRATPPPPCSPCPTSTWPPTSAKMFRTKRFRVYTTDDVVGVEMAGALKNVYAIAVGMGYSLGIGENTRAMVMARAVREMSQARRGRRRPARHLLRPGRHGRPHRHLHRHAQPQPPRRRGTGLGQDRSRRSSPR